MRAVFDTNVVVAGLVAERLCREILEIHVPEYTVILAQVLWDELVVTLRRTPFGTVNTRDGTWPSAVGAYSTGAWSKAGARSSRALSRNQ